MKRKTLPLLCIILLAGLSGCMSVPDPADVPVEKTIGELSQKGQESMDRSNYKAAEVYYQLIIDRFGTDTAALTAAEFEIAHIRVKQKHWDDARTRLEAILARYETTGSTTLPPEYRVLARNDLARIPGAETAAGTEGSGSKAQTEAK
jgi:hypothetical protein